MTFLYELLPVFLFFLAFKFYGIYAATIVGIASTFIQVIITRLWMKTWDKKQLITFAIFVLFGGMTLYFHNPIFVKWKPTVVFWIFSLAILITHFFTSKPLIQRLMEGALQEKGEIPAQAWRRLNLAWAMFFLMMGFVNIYIAYQFSNDAWVNFKFYGITAALFVFSIAQALCLSRYMTDKT